MPTIQGFAPAARHKDVEGGHVGIGPEPDHGIDVATFLEAMS